MQPLGPAIFIVFGITGDLARRKLLPALYHLAEQDLLPEPFKLVGVTRRGTTPEKVITAMRESVEAQGDHCDPAILKKLKATISIVTMDTTDEAEYKRLKVELDKIEDELGLCLSRLFYLAIPAQIFGPIVTKLGTSKLNNGCQHGVAESRLLIEKPFGYDLESAKELITSLEHVFTSEQIYRIDHYLAKETVQNILIFRSKNALFKDVWDSRAIKGIIIRAAESIGIEGRVAFYEQLGALRDVIQNHLLQILSLITMELPTQLSADHLHAAKVRLLKHVVPPAADAMATKTIRGQYESYRQEVQNRDSQTETFASIELTIDDERWRNVPITLVTGKNLDQKITEVVLNFAEDHHETSNTLTIHIQPQEGIALNMRVKKPGFGNEVEPVVMDFRYAHGKLDANHPDAYERILVDAMRGDKTLFATREEVLESWRIVQPILDAWSNNHSSLRSYKDGSSGPA